MIELYTTPRHFTSYDARSGVYRLAWPENTGDFTPTLLSESA